jgi:hypothetical protein
MEQPFIDALQQPHSQQSAWFFVEDWELRRHGGISMWWWG